MIAPHHSQKMIAYSSNQTAIAPFTIHKSDRLISQHQTAIAPHPEIFA